MAACWPPAANLSVHLARSLLAKIARQVCLVSFKSQDMHTWSLRPRVPVFYSRKIGLSFAAPVHPFIGYFRLETFQSVRYFSTFQNIQMSHFCRSLRSDPASDVCLFRTFFLRARRERARPLPVDQTLVGRVWHSDAVRPGAARPTRHRPMPRCHAACVPTRTLDT
eukprot:2570998-Pleurochrysis_carterae.AAC.6